MGWRIIDWHEHFEPPPSRQSEGPLKYWKCPTSIQSKRIVMLKSERSWEQLYCKWVLLAGVCARQSRRSREHGILRTGLAGITPATSKEITVLMGYDKRCEPSVRKALTYFVKLGWLEKINNGWEKQQYSNRTATVQPPYTSRNTEKNRVKTRLKEEKSVQETNSIPFVADATTPDPPANLPLLAQLMVVKAEELLRVWRKENPQEKTQQAADSACLKNLAAHLVKTAPDSLEKNKDLVLRQLTGFCKQDYGKPMKKLMGWANDKWPNWNKPC